MLAARSEDKLAELAAELGGDERALAVPTDVTEWADNEAMVAAALERFGRLDVVFANAGFGAARGFLNETPEHWRAMVLTNVLGAAYTVRATLPALKETRGPRAADRLGRRPPGAARLPLLGDEVGGHRDRRSRPRRPQRHRHPHHADRPGHRGDAVLRQPGEGRLRPTTSPAPCSTRSPSRRTSTSTRS